jgi:pyruvate,orthophosphate dikinase
LQVWANADYPRDAQRARDFGAQGIGLCRTEHMFFEQERLPTVQKMILSASEAQACYAKIRRAEDDLKRQPDDPKLIQAVQEVKKEAENNTAVQTYEGALASLLPIQRGDFLGILRTMHGLPVIIRLIDPPLHEFLPSYEELLVEITELKCKGGDPHELAEKEALLKEVAAMREANPMLGLRGCRLGITMPQITQMQVRAILEAACLLTKEGVEVHPEIMIPLVGHVNELKNQREALESVARQVTAEQGVSVDYKFGTMIEIPRAALTADQIAEYAQFFSFGTNDLTQMVFGISRDDAEGKFLLWYVDQKLLPDNPFQVLDREGVGQLMRTCVEKGRRVQPELSIGVCGEHGGDPSSIEFCHMIGLNYVSCSPFRVPVARLAAAQAALTKAEKDK